MRGVPLISVTVIAAIALTGCGGGNDESSTASAAGKSEIAAKPEPKKDLRKMSVTMDGYSGPENVGVVVAKWEDYFDAAGVDVTTFSPIEPDLPVKYAANETTDLGITRMPELVLAQSKGVPVVGIGALVAEPTASMIWLGKSEIEDIADLKGKTISTAGLPVQEEMLKTVLADAGLSLPDVKLKNSNYNMVPALAKGKVDAIFGASWNLEGVQLEEMGLDPVITKVQDLGIPPYDEYVVIANSKRLEKDPKPFRAFMAAVSRGVATAIEDPELALEAVEEDVESDYRVTPDVRKAQIQATNPLLSESLEMDPAQTEALVDWMQREGMIRKKIPVPALLTNEFLPQPSAE